MQSLPISPKVVISIHDARGVYSIQLKWLSLLVTYERFGGFRRHDIEGLCYGF